MAPTAKTDPRIGTNGGASADRDRVGDLVLKRPKSARRREMAAAVAVIALFAVGGLLWYLTTLDRTEALAVERSLARGETIEADDLITVNISDDGSLASLSPGQADLVVGDTAAVPLQAGTLLTTDLVVEAAPVGPEDGLVGLSLEAGQYPTVDLAPGDAVEVVVSPSGATSPADDPVVARGEVYSVTELADSERRLVTLRATKAQADAVAALDPSVLRLVWVAPS